MSINDDTVRNALMAKLAISDTVDAATRSLASAWSTAWDEIVAEWSAVVDEIVNLTDGEWPSRRDIWRATRATEALKHTAAQLQELTRTAGITITGDLPAIITAAEQWSRTIALSQLPDMGVAVNWGRVNEKALDDIVTRTTQQIESLLKPLPKQQQSVMRATLIRGIAVGDNPREAARLMLQRLGGVFDGGRNRAEVIARTEMLDAYRAANTASLNANTSVVASVMWSATKSDRTCPACLALDGTTYPVGTPGPIDHQCGRCTFIPVTKTWKELGFTGIEEPPAYQTGREWFAQQPEDVQRQIMGAERLSRLQSGDLDWDQIAVVRHSDGWRDSIGIRPLAA